MPAICIAANNWRRAHTNIVPVKYFDILNNLIAPPVQSLVKHGEKIQYYTEPYQGDQEITTAINRVDWLTPCMHAAAQSGAFSLYNTPVLLAN